MGRTRVFLLLVLFSGSILLLVALGCAGAASQTTSMNPAPPGGGGGSGGSGGGSGGSGGSGGGNGGGGGGNTPPSASRFIYGGPGFETGSVQAGTINSSNGMVSPVAGSPFDEGMGQSNLLQIAADARGRFIYVLNVAAFGAGTKIGDAGLCGFAVNHQTGALSRVPGCPVTFSTSNDNQIALDGTGHFLFEPNGQNGSAGAGFDVYSIDQSSGGLTKNSSGSNAPPVGSFTAADSAGHFIFNAGNGLAEVFNINSSSGQLAAAGAPMTTSGSAGPLAISADGKFLYVANQKEGTLAVFSVGASGMLAPVTGSPFTIDNGAQYLTLTPDGKFLYIASATQTSTDFVQTVKGYAVNPSAGTVAPISGAVVNGATTATVDLSGKFAYISSIGKLTTYSIDATTGALSQISTANAPSSDNPNDMVTVM